MRTNKKATVFVVAAPEFEGGIERFISDEVFKGIDRDKFMKVFISGDIALYDGEPMKKRINSSFYDDEKYYKYIKRIITSPVWEFLNDGDIILIMDFWFPALNFFKYYLNFVLNKDVKIVSFFHGASFVDGDLMKEQDAWVLPSEYSWIEIYDKILCASKFFYYSFPEKYRYKVKIVGSPFYPKDYEYMKQTDKWKKIYDVCYPHRLQEDKSPEDLIKIIKMLPSKKFIIMGNSKVDNEYTRELKTLQNVEIAMNLPEHEHLEKLSQSKVVLSTARQEGWGYGVMKAIALGCIPVVPNRAVYTELYPYKYRYDDLNRATDLIRKFTLNYPIDILQLKEYNISDAVNKALEELICNE